MAAIPPYPTNYRHRTGEGDAARVAAFREQIGRKVEVVQFPHIPLLIASLV